MIERDSQGEGNLQEQGGHAVNSPSHQPDKLSSFPPATMLPLKSKRVGLTNSSLYPPKINHSRELEWDTDFSRMKSWGGGWNILNMSQLARAGDCGTHSPDQVLPRSWVVRGSCSDWEDIVASMEFYEILDMHWSFPQGTQFIDTSFCPSKTFQNYSRLRILPDPSKSHASKMHSSIWTNILFAADFTEVQLHD